MEKEYKQGILFDVPEIKFDNKVFRHIDFNDEKQVRDFIVWQKLFCRPLLAEPDLEPSEVKFWDYEVIYCVDDEEFTDFWDASEHERFLEEEGLNYFASETKIKIIINNIVIEEFYTSFIEIESKNEVLRELEEFDFNIQKT